MMQRSRTRTWPPPVAPVEQVQDPAVREILRIVSRSLKAICPRSIGAAARMRPTTAEGYTRHRN